MAMVAKRRLTEEEFVHLPDDGRKYELVNGEAKEVPAGVRHDAIVASLIVQLHPFTKGHGAVTVQGDDPQTLEKGRLTLPDRLRPPREAQRKGRSRPTQTIKNVVAQRSVAQSPPSREKTLTHLNGYTVL